MKYYNISVNGVAYSVSVEETAAGAAPVAPAAAPAPKAAPAPDDTADTADVHDVPLLLLPQALLRSRLRCPATSWT